MISKFKNRKATGRDQTLPTWINGEEKSSRR